MSVWKSTTFKLDIAKEIWRSFPGNIENILGPTISSYLSPRFELSGLEETDKWDDMASAAGWGNRDYNPDNDSLFSSTYTGVKKWFVGTSAIYAMIEAIRIKRFCVKPAYPYEVIDEVVEEFGKVIMPSTQASPVPFMNTWRKTQADYMALGHMYEDCSEAFKFMRFAFQASKVDACEIDQIKYFGSGSRVYYGHLAGNLCIMKGAAEYNNRGLVLTRTHVSILVEALARLANIYYYLASEYADLPQDAELVHKMVEFTITSSAAAKRKNADKVVQAFHKARMFAQMIMFDNLHIGAIQEARAELMEKGLIDVIDMNRYTELVEDISKVRRADLLQVYKWMPPPDFDSTYAFAELHDFHTNTRPSGADPEATQEMRALWKLVQDERKRNLAVAYHKQTHEHFTIEGDTRVKCTNKNIEEWEVTKFYPYRSYADDVVTQIKDKATVSASMQRELQDASRDSEKSFLLWYMENSDNINTEKDLKALSDGVLEEDNYAKVAYKGEAHKPGSRLFFMAPPRQRILLGELEGNISNVAEFYPGSLQGKDAHRKSEMLQTLFDVYQDPPGIPDCTEYEVFVITFDLAKFSPKSNANVTRDYHKFWADVFGRPELADLYKIGPESEIIHTQSGLVMRYANQGADLEGFRGRMMTLFHADMLGAACRKALSEDVITGKSVLAVFIDDGAVKIAARGYDDEAIKNANRFLEIMQEVYAAAGQENNPNKTIVSKIGGELLAEQYLDGTRLKCPIKAAMRLYPEYENPVCCITEEFDALFAATQGVAKDQGFWVPTYKRYITAVVKSIHRWAPGMIEALNKLELCLKMITPKSYGGFGVQPLQGVVSTGTLNLTAEGFGLLNRVARAYPETRGRVKNIVTRPVMQRDPLAVLRDPLRVRANVPVLVENRLMMSIVKKLEEPENIAARFMQGYRDINLRAHAEAVAEAILKSEQVSLPLMLKAWRATPLAYVEGVVSKFRRARTIIKMLGRFKIQEIRRKNKEDVRAVLQQSI